MNDKAVQQSSSHTIPQEEEIQIGLTRSLTPDNQSDVDNQNVLRYP